MLAFFTTQLGNKSAKIFHKIFLVLMSRRFALKAFLGLKFFKVKANTKYHLALNPKKAHVNVVYAYLTKLLSNDFTSRFSDIVIKIICIYLSDKDFLYHDIMNISHIQLRKQYYNRKCLSVLNTNPSASQNTASIDHSSASTH